MANCPGPESKSFGGVRAAPAVGETVLRDGLITPLAPDTRSATFQISDESKDRYGDIITASGWDFAQFKLNPIVLWGHQSRELPIGRVDKLWQEGTKSLAEVRFATADENPFADSVYKMVKAGFVNASSVGFRPTAPIEWIKEDGKETGGMRFVGQELLELSVVTVPALPTALVQARAFDLLGVPDEDVKRIVFDPGPGALARHGDRKRKLEMMRLGVSP